ncbi:hypothetical protein HYPSUDRAFT_219501 [Hypholoma sublateritium FD-334 SS-4]|uniref:DUF1772 domain-containing protein n=1 Tax=Hypholoma sublateritium (strain FD-334 SS-4) TaxID=945553 RepID=A0A0D2LZQ0_HYPSF|nr:hypothetical protein HYPSUDRAFT_219501 [Hypholoma sublateritium FD-334 SS-4]
MSTAPLNSFISRATASPFALSLGLGLGTVSYYFWGNVASQVFGAISIPIHPKDRKKLGIDTSKGVEIWAWAYKLGAKHMGVSAAVSGLAVMAAAFQLPAAKELSISRKYLLLLSAGLLSNGIWTVAIMLPTNNRLIAIRDKIVLRKSGAESSISSLTVAEEEEAETLLQKWKRMHYVRLGLGALGYIGTLAAYVTTI